MKRIRRRRWLQKTHPRVWAKLRRRQHVKRRLKLLFILFVGMVLISGSVFGLLGFRYLQQLDDSLPEIGVAFQRQSFTTRLYDRFGEELYKLVGDEARDPVVYADIPEHVRWAFIAAEDINFYEHAGVDADAITRCTIIFLTEPDKQACGGSTITQQLVKITTRDNKLSVERKLREVLLSLKVEQKYSKDDILQQYLTVVPMGSNLYGLTTGASYYFGKLPKELTLAEASLLAAIIQNPVALSPTLGLPDPTVARAKAMQRQAYILDQLEEHLEYINQRTRANHNDPELSDVYTRDMIAAARTEVLTYKQPVYTQKKAGHFVDYVTLMLTTRPYKNGEPFTLSELQTGGYKVYTTLDYQMQLVAENEVRSRAGNFRSGYGANNVAMMTMQPATGEILTMVGSKDYNAPSEGCNAAGDNCLFDPQVNVLATKQSPGSSTKPFATYEAYRQGKLFTGSLLPDVPIKIGDYQPKNWNGTFFGVNSSTTAARMLCMSRNLPAIVVLETIGGKDRFLQVLRDFGYSTYNDSARYGPSVILGGADVIGIEHAQAYAVFANGGDFVQHEVVQKIVDSHGNLVYEHKPERKHVGDPRAIYMLNYSLVGCNGSSWDGRNVSAKTGTSEDNSDVWTAFWSPDFVTVAWAGNNNNAPMSYRAYGETITVPLIKNFMRQVGDSSYFVGRSQFPMPPGLIYTGGQNVRGFQSGLTGGLMIADKPTPVDVLNRRIDCGGQVRYVQYYKMPVPYWQNFLDAYLARQGRPNGGGGC